MRFLQLRKKSARALDFDRSSSGAAILTVGDELLSGMANANSAWLARELDELGIETGLIVTLPDDRAAVAAFVRWASGAHELVFVTGGLGVTPDDVTCDAVADAFGVDRIEDATLSSELTAAGGHSAEFASVWSRLPKGSTPLERIAGGAPAFAIENVYVLAGMSAEMQATFDGLREGLHRGPTLGTWRRTFRTTEDRIMPVLRELRQRHQSVRVGSYPAYGHTGPSVELVLRASQPSALRSAASLVEAAIAGTAALEPAHR